MWSNLVNWLFDLIASIGKFGQFLFTRYTFTDVVLHWGGISAKVTNQDPSVWEQAKWLIKETIANNDFTNKMLNGVSFTPIGLISVSGLVVVLIVGVIKKFNIFA